MYLLHLQYRSEWEDFCDNDANYASVAMAECRDMFVKLATNVKAVRMEKMSTLIQNFFCTPQEDYTLPFDFESAIKAGGDGDDEIKSAEDVFAVGQPLQFETICLLFPNAKQISINADNWDFSLKRFIQFLDIFDHNFSGVALQDIYIRFVSDGKIVCGDKRARKERKKVRLMFSTPAHLHRIGVESLSLRHTCSTMTDMYSLSRFRNCLSCACLCLRTGTSASCHPSCIDRTYLASQPHR